MLLGNPWCLWISGWIRRLSRRNGIPLPLLYVKQAIEIDFGLSVNDGDGKQVAYQRTPSPRTFSTNMEDDDGLNSWGFHNFALRSDLMSPLVDGTLVIEVHMKLAMPTKSVPPPFIPENPSACKMIQGLFMNDKSANIVFEVGGNKGKVMQRRSPRLL